MQTLAMCLKMQWLKFYGAVVMNCFTIRGLRKVESIITRLTFRSAEGINFVRLR